MNQILKPSIDRNDYIECEYCKNKLYRKTIDWNLYGTKRVMKLIMKDVIAKIHKSIGMNMT